MPSPVTRIAPKPRRLTGSSPPISKVRSTAIAPATIPPRPERYRAGVSAAWAANADTSAATRSGRSQWGVWPTPR